MNGERFYTFAPKAGVRFFALDSNYMDRTQLAWLERELAASGSDWKIAFFHHPIYSSGGRHGSDLQLRALLEPLFLKYGVDLVLAGHEHFYERIKPQKGIVHFVVGSGGKLAVGDLDARSPLTARGYDTDYAFLVAEIVDDQMFFNAVSRRGDIIDSGIVLRRRAQEGTATAAVAWPAELPELMADPSRYFARVMMPCESISPCTL